MIMTSPAVYLLDVDLSSGTPVLAAWLMAPDPEGVEAGATVSYRWQQSANGSDWQTISGAIGHAFTPGALYADRLIRFEISYRDGSGHVEVVQSAASTPAHRLLTDPLPVQLAAGDSQEGVPIQSTIPSGTSVLAYQWQRPTGDGAWLAIIGASAASYTPVDADADRPVRLQVRYAAGSGLAQTAYLETDPIVNLDDDEVWALQAPTGLKQGQALTLVATSAGDLLQIQDPDDPRLSVRWEAWRPSQPNVIEDLGVNARRLQLGQEHVGRLIRATVLYADPGKAGEEVSVLLTTSDVVADVNDLPQGALAIDGSPAQREILSARAEFFDIDQGVDPIDADRLSWQWYFEGPTAADHDDVLIPAATTPSLSLTQAHVNQAIKVAASYTDAAGFQNTIVSGPTERVQDINDPPQGSLLIQGGFIEGQILTLTDQTGDDDGLPASGSGERRYQWLLDGSEVIGEGLSLTLTQAHLGSWNPDHPEPGRWGSRSLSARVVWVDHLGNAEEVLSEQSGPVRNVNDPPSGTIGVQGSGSSGPPREREVLRADLVELSDADGIDLWSRPAVWSWFLGGLPIAGAEGPDLEIDRTMIGRPLSVRAEYVDGFGTSERLVRELGTVLNEPDPATGLIWIAVPEGRDPQQGDTLAAQHDLADEDGMPDAAAIQWTWHARYPGGHPMHPNGFEEQIGSGATLTLSQAEVGAQIQLRARFVDRLGGEERPAPGDWTFPAGNIDDPPDFGNLGIQGVLAQGGTLELAGWLTDPDLRSLANPSARLTAGSAALTVLWEAIDATGSVRDLGLMGPTLPLTQDLVGSRIQARISYVDPWGGAVEQTLATAVPGAAVGDVNDPADGIFQIAGAAEQGAQLSVEVAITDADEGYEAIDPARLSWRWFVEGPTADDHDDVPLEGSLASTLLLGQEHVGQLIKVQGSYRDARGFDNQLLSAAFGPIADLDDPPRGALRIEGTYEQGQVLTLIDTIEDPDGIPAAGQDGARRYVWLLGGQEIEGQRGNTLTLAQEHVGYWWDGNPEGFGDRAISAVLEYTDRAGNFMQIATEQPSEDRVRNVNDPPVGPEILGELREGETLSLVFDSLKDADGVDPWSVSWQWFADDQLVGTDVSLTLALEHIGRSLSLQASYTDGFGHPEILRTRLGVVANRPDPATGELWITIDGERALEQGASLLAEHRFEDPDFPAGGPAGSEIDWTWHALWPVDQAQGSGREVSIGAGERLTLTQAHVGAEIELRAHFTDRWGDEAGPFVARTFGSVADRDDEPSGSLVIAGSRRVGRALTLTGTVTDLDSATPESPQGELPLHQLSNLDVRWEARRPEADSQAFLPLWGLSGTDFEPGPELLGQQIRAVVSWTDGGGFPETLTIEADGPVLAEPARLTGQIYHWRSHALLAGVEVSIEPMYGPEPSSPDGGPTWSPATTFADGQFRFEDLPQGAYQLVASSEVSAGELTAAITTADAMAALKLSLGRNPNPDPDGPGPLQPVPVSPYQWIAADLDGDGRVDRSDAQAILRIATGQSDPRAGWSFIAEGEDFLIEQGLDGPVFERPSAEVSRAAPVELELGTEGVFHAPRMGDAALEGYAFPSANLVGVLRGDVDGSWAWSGSGDGGTAVFLPPSYFTGLAALVPGIDIVHPAQFWVF
jgi:hypothetical protein